MDAHPTLESSVTWRAHEIYLPSLASKTGLLTETRLFLQTLTHRGDLAATRRALVDGALPQRARETRATIVKVIHQRLFRWSPPSWVVADLCAFAADRSQPALAAALLLHVARQDALLYAVVQQVVLPRWHAGEHLLIRADVQGFLDRAEPSHPEIDGWSHATREKLAGNVLSVLRDYGLLQGTARKEIVEPNVPDAVAEHLVRLLRAEGLSDAAIAGHPDWQLWLWDNRRVRLLLSGIAPQEAAV
jgi:hypothetical protein